MAFNHLGTNAVMSDATIGRSGNGPSMHRGNLAWSTSSSRNNGSTFDARSGPAFRLSHPSGNRAHRGLIQPEAIVDSFFREPQPKSRTSLFPADVF